MVEDLAVRIRIAPAVAVLVWLVLRADARAEQCQDALIEFLYSLRESRRE
jgi:hypothetical protein